MSVIVLIGCHGAGKTSLGEALARRLGLPFDDEIGRRLASDAALRPPGQTAAHSQAPFDQAVFEAELARDLERRDRPRVIETWHPGNLAYAAARSPAVAARWLAAVRQTCRRDATVVVPVRAPMAVLQRRQSEPGDVRFFIAVALAAERWAAFLGLPVLPPVWTHRARPAELADEVGAALARRVTATPR
jgi:predicted ATPase